MGLLIFFVFAFSVGETLHIRSHQSIRCLQSLGLVYHSRDFPRYLIGKGLVGEIRGGHPEILSHLLFREGSGSVVEYLTRD